MNSIGVIVLGVSNPIGLEVIRSLGEKGINIIAVHDQKRTIGFYSKYVQDRLLLNSIKGEYVIATLLKLGLKKQGWVLIPTSDYYVSLVSKNLEKLSKYFILTTPPWNVIKLCLDKVLTYKIADELGINVPQTYCAKNEAELKTIVSQMDFKTKTWIIKTRSSVLCPKGEKRLFVKKKAVEIKSKKDLIEIYLEHLKSTGESLLIQERIRGLPGRNVILRTVINRQFKPLVVITDKKIRQLPLFFGVGSYRESIYEPEIIKFGLKLLKKIGYYGIAYVEFKRDSKDGQLKLIEINPRFTSGVSLAKACGIDLVHVLFNSFCDMEHDLSNKFEIGIRWWDIHSDLKTILNHRSFLPWTKTISDIISNLHRTKAFGFFSLKDPLPFFINILTKVKKQL